MNIAAMHRGDEIVERPISQRMLALAGAVAPLIFFGLLIGAGLMRPGYSPIRQFGSELEVGPHAWLVHADFILVGLLEIGFAFGLQRGIDMGRHKYTSTLGPLLIGVAGCGMVLIGLFSGGTMHGRAVKVHSYGMMIAYVVLAQRLWQDRRWHRYAPYSIVAAALAFIPWAGMMWVHDPQVINPVIGLVQRLHYFILFAWVEVMALRLLALPRSGIVSDGPMRTTVTDRHNSLPRSPRS